MSREAAVGNLNRLVEHYQRMKAQRMPEEHLKLMKALCEHAMDVCDRYPIPQQ